VDGRPINVDIAQQRSAENTPRGGAGGGERAQRYGDKISEPSATLFVGNMNFNTTQDGLWELFGSTGAEVQSVRIPTDKESGQPKG
jgi:nucleolin